MQQSVVDNGDRSGENLSLKPRAYKAMLKRLVEYAEDDLEVYTTHEQEVKERLQLSLNMMDFEDGFVFALVRTMWSRDMEEAEARLARVKALLTRIEVKENPEKFTGELAVEQAKKYPMKNFFKMNSSRKVCCIFHNERTPSMHVYADNHFHCYSCDKTGDVIDVVMQMQSLDFKAAVDYLNKL